MILWNLLNDAMLKYLEPKWLRG